MPLDPDSGFQGQSVEIDDGLTDLYYPEPSQTGSSQQTASRESSLSQPPPDFPSWERLMREMTPRDMVASPPESVTSEHESDLEDSDDPEEHLTVPEMEVQLGIIRDGTITLDAIKHALLLDEHFEPIISDIIRGKRHNQYELVSHILFRKSANGPLKICIPASLLEHVWFNEHYSPLGQHRTAHQITRTLDKNYYAPNMLNTFRSIAAKCYYCITNTSNTSRAHTLHSNLTAERPREVWSFDIASGFKLTKRGHTNIHLFIDNFSLYTVLVPSNSKSSEAIIESLKTHIVQPFTAPSGLRSDGELGLVKAQSAQEFAHAHGIKLLPTAAASPWSNGVAEGRIKVVKQLIRSTLAANQAANPDAEWDDNIYLLQTALNQTAGANGYTPEEILFGFRNVRPNDPLMITDPPVDVPTFMTQVRATMIIMHEHVLALRQAHRTLNDTYKNAKAKTRTFVQGQLVWVLCKVIKGQSALIARKRGPYVIEEVSYHSQTASLREMSTGTITKQHSHVPGH